MPSNCTGKKATALMNNADLVKDKVVLITGGTGSFGKTMVKTLLEQSEAKEVRVFSRDEEKQDSMRTSISNERIKYYIGDVRDRSSIDSAMRGVDFVFHAAALKQVPSCEFFPMQAVQTNVNGSSNVLLSAIENGVRSVVCLSTDKAVFPINAMGMTKALMEKVAQSYARNLSGEGETVISCVRYGNVMYSRGSVIPLFVNQILSGNPVTITESRMTRFLMPLVDSVELVLFAFANAQPGDIFIKKAPAAQIGTLVDSLKSLLEVPDCAVKEIGVRHGEKLYETLASGSELSRAKDLGPYFQIPMDGRELNYSEFVSSGDSNIFAQQEYNSANTTQLDVGGVKELLMQLPEMRELVTARSA